MGDGEQAERDPGGIEQHELPSAAAASKRGIDEHTERTCVDERHARQVDEDRAARRLNGAQRTGPAQGRPQRRCRGNVDLPRRRHNRPAVARCDAHVERWCENGLCSHLGLLGSWFWREASEIGLRGTSRGRVDE